MEHLIADSGIQFIIKEIEFNPMEPMLISRGKPLKYSFVETEDILEGTKIFNILYYNSYIDKYIPLDELQVSSDAILRRTNGREILDEAGLPKMCENANTTFFTTYDDKDDEIYNISSLQSFRVVDPKDGHSRIAAFNLLLDKWLPMPMFRKEIDGITSSYPFAWCRMKMQKIGKGSQSGKERYRLIWAFDTQLGEDALEILRPTITEEDNGTCEYTICNKVDLLLDFMGSSEEFHAFSDYIASLLGIDTSRDESSKFKAFYIYFINYIRLSGGAPEITLHNNLKRQIPVDLVLDIGNSRTCGILFEEGDFLKGTMLQLRNLSDPWIPYENKTFDMRVVFRKADFGDDIVLEEDMFQWKSFVRLGDEARCLIYRSLEEDGISEKTTNYSSPKRYLWDDKEYPGQWENLVTTEDPFSVLLATNVAVPGLSKLFKNDGTYLSTSSSSETGSEGEMIDFEGKESRYSRKSLMTFAFIEIFQQAISQINSIKFREKWGNIDVRRTLRNVIITCPTAMPIKEQVTLRQCAYDAFEALTLSTPKLGMPQIIPSPKALKVINPYAPTNQKVWKYDEASCCQLVYLYAEIAKRYGGEINKFFELKGHVRPEEKETGYKNKSLTIGSVDIGAGTTDIMICSYQYEGTGATRITPNPLFWDSFYLAGDDILKNLVQSLVIEGPDHRVKNLGNISSALTARILEMTDSQLRDLPCMDNIVYKNKIEDICRITDEADKTARKEALASNLIHDFFGTDSSMMSYRDRRCRNDFNIQISVPIAQKMLELLRTHSPSKLYTYAELFPDIKPAHNLLDYFEHHFGFRFEELTWRYNPEEVSAIVKSTMEPLLKQLALILYKYNCDIIVLAGRPTSLDAITELFLKYIPVSPDRLIRLNEYRVGSWFPTADGQGYFYDQKSIVAIGGMVGYLASHAGLKGLVIDFDNMIQKMTSTANYIGLYNSSRQQVTETYLSPQTGTASFTVSVFPTFIGCKQLRSTSYQARPLYAIYNHGQANTLEIRISRDFHNNKEEIVIEEVTDNNYVNRKKDIEIIPQSLVDDGKYWLDKGEFELTIK